MISPINLQDHQGPIITYTYDGTAKEPSLTVTDGSPSIIAAGDYTVSYTDNVNAGTATATITATAEGNYSGSASITFLIGPKPLAAEMVAEITDKLIFNCQLQEPLPAVKDGSASIIHGQDYTVEYTDNVNAGTATVTITAIPGGNYSGSISTTFLIGKKPLSSSMISDITESFTYDGTAKEPSLTVTDGSPSIITAGDYTVSYTDNVEAGTATATITATAEGNYSGSAFVTFTIGKKALSSSMIAEITESLTYDGTGKEPALTVSDGSPSIIAEGDYTVSYANNIEAGTAIATITATAEGNYSGSASADFTIGKKALTAGMIGEIIEAFTYDGTAKEPALTVTDGSPSIIAEGDYIVSYANNTDAGTATATITATGDGNYSGSASADFTIGKKALDDSMMAEITVELVYNGTFQEPVVTIRDGEPSILEEGDYTLRYVDNFNAGTGVAIITATEEGNYLGSASVTFTIGKKPLADGMIKAISGTYTYDGKPKEPVLEVRDGEPSIIGEGDYTVTYINNVRAGTGTAVITATENGNYLGSASVDFTILPAPVVPEEEPPVAEGIDLSIEAEEKILSDTKEGEGGFFPWAPLAAASGSVLLLGTGMMIYWQRKKD